jgi:protein-tyrosine phosphatase
MFSATWRCGSTTLPSSTKTRAQKLRPDRRGVINQQRNVLNNRHPSSQVKLDTNLRLSKHTSEAKRNFYPSPIEHTTPPSLRSGSGSKERYKGQEIICTKLAHTLTDPQTIVIHREARMNSFFREGNQRT